MIPAGIPPVQLLGDAVLIRGSAVRDTLALVGMGVQQARRDGIPPSPRVQALLAALAAAREVQSCPPPDAADVRNVAARAESEMAREIGSRGVAEILKLSHRQVRRLAADLGGRRSPSGGWIFNQGTVDAYKAARDEGGP